MSNIDERPTKILIVFYSRYGNTARMAEEIAYGAKELSNIQVTIRRLADNISMEVISKDPAWTKIAENLKAKAKPMKTMWDGTTELWTSGALLGKIGAVFTECRISTWWTRDYSCFHDVSHVSSWDDIDWSPIFC